MIEFKNESSNKFVDISSEISRTYEYPPEKDISGWYTITIVDPLQLSTSKSGGHRIFDAAGVSHYIQPGWKHLYWKVKEGQPNFVK
jgi:hypothetical protein